MKVFLHVGANKGQNIPNIKKVYGDDYDIYSFEPNPECIKILKISIFILKLIKKIP